ncbi:DUF4214 domain-containing protein [Teichococcus vastitatis]|uniref:DUF4214 domain-containing protein n=1 Tax=Teichococcus vastitatis TaxID=2307076 RepID=UPI000E76D4DF|nr:DUF4214 domain-containing protein [Pseudoroseomonas vastitatis]
MEFLAPPGTGFSPQDQGNNDAVDSDANPATGRSASFAVTSGQSVANLSAGFLTSTTLLGGDVWLDADGNGLRDAGEQLLQGVRVRLLDAAGQPLGPATVTDAAGHYAFLNLQAGSYRVGYAPLIGTAFTAQDRGADEAIDSDASPVNGVSSLLVTLAPGVSDLRGGAGLVLDLGRSPNYAPNLGLGNGNDGYPGTDYAEIVHGNGGDDSINGLGGNDSFYGGAGNDSLNGHGGDDVLDGGAGNDNVQGREGDDILLGGSGDDIGEGGNGNDVLIAGSGADNMQSENGDDYLFGGAGNDILTGNQGHDVVAGGNGDDSLQGADGTDIVIGGRDAGRMSLDGDGHATGVATGDMLEGNGGADAFVYQAGDGVDLLLDFNPAEGDTLTIYGHTGFQVVERTPEGRMALYLGSNAGFILNNGTFQGETAASTLPGVRFVASNAEAPNAIMGRDVVVPVLAQNWVSNFTGAGPIAVSQDFPAFAAAPDLTNLSGVTFERLVRRGNENEVRFLPPSNEWLEAGGGYDVLVTGEGFRGTRSTALPEDGLRLDLGGGTHLLRGVEAVRFVDGTLHLGPDSAAAQIVRLYEVALGRPADQAWLNAWLDVRQRGAPLTSVTDAFLQSPEFAQRYGANLSNADYVELLYNNALGRASDPGGKAGWVTGLENGSITRAGGLAGFSESAENRARTAEDVAPGIWDASENAAFLARLYDTTLGRLPDRAGLQAWREGMDAGIFTVTDVVNGFTASAEFKARYGSATSTGDFVELLYNNALDRAADPAGKAAWGNAIDRNVISRADAVLGFSESAEHRALTAANIMNETPDQFGILFA